MEASANDHVLDAILDRVRGSLDRRLDAFPVFADPMTGAWSSAPDGSWTGGFWAGMLWLLARRSKASRDRQRARSWTRRLTERVQDNTVFTGLLLWYGAGVGHQLLDDSQARTAALTGARSLTRSYDETSRLIPIGAAFSSLHGPSIETNIDGVAGSVALLGWASEYTGESAFLRIANDHARRHLEICLRADGSICPAASLDAETGAVIRRHTQHGLNDTSTWSRGQAWAMLAYAQATRWLSADYAESAVQIADWWISRTRHHPVAPWDFDDPEGGDAVVDTSATAIAASSLLKLAVLVPKRSTVYRAVAAGTIDALVRWHLTPLSPNEQRPAGMLIDGCHRRRSLHASNRELIWGTYFLAEALLTIDGTLDATLI